MKPVAISRRRLLQLGLLAGPAATLVAENAVAAHADGSSSGGTVKSPRLTPFVEPLPVMPVLPSRSINELTPAPTIYPNRYVNPATSLPYEGRTENHQFRDRFPVGQYFVTRVGANRNARPHPDLPPQTFWGFNLGGEDLTADPPLSPGPTIVTRYGTPVLIRRYNALPPAAENGGFGAPEISTHLHNFHSGPDSDGGPCDPLHQRYFYRGQYYDYFHTMYCAGFDSTHPPLGDIRETLGTLWYHDHRVDHTAENTYKGLAGFLLAFNDFDTGDESTGFHLPGFPDYDIPVILGDKLFDPTTGLLYFNSFGFDGLVGDTFLANGKVQPFFEPHKRRYRFRILDGGPSRFYELFLTNPDNLAQKIPFWVIASDGNLLPRPVEVTSIRLSVAERYDVIIDFAKIAARFGNPSRLNLENRLEQVNGRGPTGNVFAAGQGTPIVQFRPRAGTVSDASFVPEPVSSPRVVCSPTDAVFAPIALPSFDNTPPRITRRFKFERGNGQWQINGKLMDCTKFRFQVQRNSVERWIITNSSGGWQHPIHIHFEEFRVISRNGKPVKCGSVEFGRKDVFGLGFGEEVEILIRFRDFLGGYPMHCHNTVHEDHQMMLLFNIAEVGDNRTQP